MEAAGRHCRAVGQGFGREGQVEVLGGPGDAGFGHGSSSHGAWCLRYCLALSRVTPVAQAKPTTRPFM